ncbi:lipid-transfer protein [Striga asiatica]|uniref:Lipid-transfer protein n=1 Tax=Striga asiatica TaxID=4170 RepID=A0A5A7RH53_STRAF|nr:lipid-transfer protein [Striga asiatica]
MEKTAFIRFSVAFLCVAVLVGGQDESSLAGKCSAQFQKVTQCLPFATAKAAAPSRDCCDSVGSLKESDPACLCFIIQQIHNGTNAAVKSMGVQETRLLQLPSACRLANASVAECPRLLHLPPNSSDAAIFTNASTSTPISTPAAPASTTASNGFMLKPQLEKYIATVLVPAIAIFLLFHASMLCS